MGIFQLRGFCCHDACNVYVMLECLSSDSGRRFITGESWIRRGITRSWESPEYTEGRRLNKMSEHSLHITVIT